MSLATCADIIIDFFLLKEKNSKYFSILFCNKLHRGRGSNNDWITFTSMPIKRFICRLGFLYFFYSVPYRNDDIYTISVIVIVFVFLQKNVQLNQMYHRIGCILSMSSFPRKSKLKIDDSFVLNIVLFHSLLLVVLLWFIYRLFCFTLRI